MSNDPALEASERLDFAEKAFDASRDDIGDPIVSAEDMSAKREAYFTALREFTAIEANSLSGLIAKLRWLAKSLERDAEEYDTRMAQALVFDAVRISQASRS